jgi:DNA-binding transcriptional regulator YiaG
LLYDPFMTTKTVITKEQAVSLFGTQSALAEALGITKGAVSQWRDGEPIPEAQALKLRYEIAPEAFKAA